MVAFFIPSGIGVREAVFTASLARQLPGGVALVWALLLRVWVTVVELAFVGIVLAVEAGVRRRRATLRRGPGGAGRRSRVGWSEDVT